MPCGGVLPNHLFVVPRLLGEGLLDRVPRRITMETLTLGSSGTAAIYNVLVAQGCRLGFRLLCGSRGFGLLLILFLLLRGWVFIRVGFSAITLLTPFIAPVGRGRGPVLAAVSARSRACL